MAREYAQTIKRAIEEYRKSRNVENALVSRKKLLEQIAAQERLVKAAGEYVRLARLQYDGGYSPYSTVLQAEQQLFPAELNYALYRASLFTSLVNMPSRTSSRAGPASAP